MLALDNALTHRIVTLIRYEDSAASERMTPTAPGSSFRQVSPGSALQLGMARVYRPLTHMQFGSVKINP